MSNIINQKYDQYSDQEVKLRKKLIKFFRGTHERFKKGTNFEKNATDFINNLFEAFKFSEDEQLLALVQKSYTELHHLLAPLRSTNSEIDKFLRIIDSLYKIEYTSIIEFLYR
jgi:hypothetical protein